MKSITITNKQEITNIINSCKTCFLSIINENGLPYTIPMNFVYLNNKIYIHTGQKSSLVNLLHLSKNICINFCKEGEIVYQHERMACSYSMKAKSVICNGIASFVCCNDLKREIMSKFMLHYTKNKTNFSDVALKNLILIEIQINEITAKAFGLKTDIG